MGVEAVYTETAALLRARRDLDDFDDDDYDDGDYQDGGYDGDDDRVNTLQAIHDAASQADGVWCSKNNCPDWYDV
jgi:hypothetical protein